jgi:C-terminal processing protease CtpA/Prc
LSAIAALAMVSSCGGGGGGSASGTGGTPTPTPSPTPTATPTPTAAGCTLRERQDWAFAQLKEWYLFPDTLPASLDPAPYTSVEDYIDALTATARAQHKDRYFTYLTSIAEEDAYYNSGSSAGLGIRLGLTSSNRLFVTEAFEGGAALATGIDRGTEIVAIGTSSSNLRTVSDIMTTSGSAGLIEALGPDTAGTTRVLRITSLTGTTSIVTVTKTAFALDPVSSRYGAKIISDGGQQFGYINLRTFINPAEQPLKDAFLRFRTNGVTNIIIDLRYNGGGLVSVADLMGDLMGANRAPTDVWEYMTFRPEKSAYNSNHTFTPMSQSIAPTKIAFIGGGGTASASELVINGMVPYLHANAALIGSNTYGKPVGQIALDKTACDDRFRVIAFAIQNAAHNGAYYDGLASFMEASCQASDDISYQLGDPNEQSTRRALDYLEGKSCTACSQGPAIGDRTSARTADARSTVDAAARSAGAVLGSSGERALSADGPGEVFKRLRQAG